MKNKTFWRDFGEGPRLFAIMENHVGEELIVFDTETTGLSPSEDRIIQLSAIKCQIEPDYELSEIDRLNLYINPNRLLPAKIVEITGITDEMLADKPNESEQWGAIHAFFGDKAIVCGHNSSFDISMIQPMYIRNCGYELIVQPLDTMAMARELHHKDETGNHKLGTLASFFGLDYGLTFHNSMDDVTATLRLLRYFIEEYRDKKANASEDINKIPTKIKSCWHYSFTSRVPNATKADGSPKYEKQFRLYVRVRHENRVLYINQRRPYDWGEKDKGSLALFDMKDIEEQVLALYKCKDLEELSKVRDSRYAS